MDGWDSLSITCCSSALLQLGDNNRKVSFYSKAQVKKTPALMPLMKFATLQRTKVPRVWLPYPYVSIGVAWLQSSQWRRRQVSQRTLLEALGSLETGPPKSSKAIGKGSLISIDTVAGMIFQVSTPKKFLRPSMLPWRCG